MPYTHLASLFLRLGNSLFFCVARLAGKKRERERKGDCVRLTLMEIEVVPLAGDRGKRREAMMALIKYRVRES